MTSDQRTSAGCPSSRQLDLILSPSTSLLLMKGCCSLMTCSTLKCQYLQIWYCLISHRQTSLASLASLHVRNILHTENSTDINYKVFVFMLSYHTVCFYQQSANCNLKNLMMMIIWSSIHALTAAYLCK